MWDEEKCIMVRGEKQQDCTEFELDVSIMRSAFSKMAALRYFWWVPRWVSKQRKTWLSLTYKCLSTIFIFFYWVAFCLSARRIPANPQSNTQLQLGCIQDRIINPVWKKMRRVIWKSWVEWFISSGQAAPARPPCFLNISPNQWAEGEGWDGEEIIKMCHGHKVLLE